MPFLRRHLFGGQIGRYVTTQNPELPVSIEERDIAGNKMQFYILKILGNEEKGTGADKPRLWDQVTVHYTSWNMEGRIIDSEGKLYATGTTTCMVFPLPTE